jgi:hypothetical protein
MNPISSGMMNEGGTSGGNSIVYIFDRHACPSDPKRQCFATARHTFELRRKMQRRKVRDISILTTSKRDATGIALKLLSRTAVFDLSEYISY